MELRLPQPPFTEFLEAARLFVRTQEIEDVRHRDVRRHSSSTDLLRLLRSLVHIGMEGCDRLRIPCLRHQHLHLSSEGSAVLRRESMDESSPVHRRGFVVSRSFSGEGRCESELSLPLVMMLRIQIRIQFPDWIQEDPGIRSPFTGIPEKQRTEIRLPRETESGLDVGSQDLERRVRLVEGLEELLVREIQEVDPDRRLAPGHEFEGFL